MSMLEKVRYGGWSNCARLSNGVIELTITLDVGPRVIRFGLVGRENMMAEYKDQLGKTGGDAWNIFGGHRFWHAPESVPRTYEPDNGPVALEEHAGFVRVIQPTEATTGMQKQIDFALDASGGHVRVTHRLINQGLWPVECAPWALSVTAQGGTAIIPLPPRGSHPEALLPGNSLTLWAYTDMSDPRWTWGQKFILLRQDPKAALPQKVGALVKDGWVACANHQQLFVKTFQFVAGATYPDLGCSVETFTNADMLEVETLGPLQVIPSGGAIEHVENWHLFDGVAAPSNDSDVEHAILPLISSIRR